MNDALAAQRTTLDPPLLAALSGVRADIDAPDLEPTLPGDHPAWQRDVLSVSSHARALISALRPVVIKVLNFWDHRFGQIAIGSRTLGVDASGCYRLK